MTDPARILRPDIAALSAAYAAGDLTPAEVAASHRAMIAARGRELGAVIQVADAPMLVRPGPLAGVPVTVKDAFDVAGMRTSVGTLAGSHVARTDAPSVARLRGAGADILGKTNVPVMLDDYQSANEDFGRTRNPWDPDRTPGGSSGGSAAAVAAGLAYADLGSDLSGSIRMPAAWCGVFAHRPSNGIVSKRGHLPWPADGLLEPPASVAGPFARSARDLWTLMRVLVGAEGPDARGWSVTLPAPRKDTLAGLRVGLWWDDPGAPIDPEMRVALEALADRMEEAGCRIVELPAVPVRGEASLELYDRIVAAEIARGLSAADAARLAAAGDPLGQSMRDAWVDREAQVRISHAWADVFTEVDVLLSPAVPGAAPTHSDLPPAQRRMDVGGRTLDASPTVSAWSRLTNLGRLPATIIPAGLGPLSGLPLGAALVGAYLEDETPLAVARLLEREGIIGFTPPPGW